MRVVNNSSAKLRMAAVIVLGGLSLSACATNYDAEFAAINSRISAVDAKATDALQRADAANAAAAAAAADARNANTRLDALTTRVDVIEQQGISRQPRN
jgi:outer membrane murein-binding lipoprotein Lpp